MGMGITPVTDVDEELVKEKLLQAAALRKAGMSGDTGAGMVGDVYVRGNPWGGIVQSLTGVLLGNQARNEQRALADRQQQEQDAFIGRMPSATMQAEVQQATPEQQFGPTQAPVTTETINKPLTQYADETRRWAMTAPRGMEAVRGAALQQAILAPEKQAELQETAKNREAQLRLSLDAQRERNATTDMIKMMMLGQTQQGLDMRREGMQQRAQEAATKQAEKDAVKVGAAESGSAQIDNMLRNVGQLITIPTDEQGNAQPENVKLTPGADAGTGKWNARWPDLLSKDRTVAARKALASLQDQMTMLNIGSARRSVGQSFGAMSEKEWPKFTNYVANLDASSPSLAKDLAYVQQVLQREKAAFDKVAAAGGATGGGAPAAGGGGTSRVLNGTTYVQDANGKWWTR